MSRWSAENVYGTAKQGLRTRTAAAFSARARRIRHEQLFTLAGATERSRVVDIGCGRLGLRRHAPQLDITGVDRVPRADYPGPFVQADVLGGLPFADGEFDLAYCSSVIEHIAPADRAAFAAELRRVGRGWWVQTPAFSFPVEPHALLPFAHWLPAPVRRRYWELGVAGEWEPELRLLRRAELAALLPGGEVVAERFGPLAKSWISVRRPD